MNTPFDIRISGAGPHHSSPTGPHDPDHLAFGLVQTLADNGYGLTVATFSAVGTVDDMLPNTAGHSSATPMHDSEVSTILQRVMQISGMPTVNKPGRRFWSMRDLPEWLGMSEDERADARAVAEA